MHPHLASALQQIGLECVCCRQIFHPTQSLDDAVEAHLFGADPFVICPVCEMNVPEGMRDTGYKERYRRAITLRANRPEWIYLIVLSALMRQVSASCKDKVFDYVLHELNVFYPDKTLPQLLNEAGKIEDLLCAIRR